MLNKFFVLSNEKKKAWHQVFHQALLSKLANYLTECFGITLDKITTGKTLQQICLLLKVCGTIMQKILWKLSEWEEC